MKKYWRVNGPTPKQFLWVEDNGAGSYVFHGDTGGPGHQPPTRSKGPTLRKSVEWIAGKKHRLAATDFKPGEYHPRIWRPHSWPRAQQHYEVEWSSALLGARNLFAGLREVFRHVEPVKQNWKTFGHEIRQLLVLSCTEVEAQFKAILRANSYKKPGNWTMANYAELAVPMRLSEWSVALFRYAGAPWLRPFAPWAQRPRGRLPWYAAYNAVKHDREVEFHQATLGNLVTAMGAVYLLVIAQFGQFGYQSFNYSELDEFGVKWPSFRLNEHYLPPHVEAGASWTARPYF